MMHLYDTGVLEIQEKQGGRRRRAGSRLRAAAAVMLTLVAGIPQGFAQQAGNTQTPSDQTSGLPAAPQPIATEPLSLRQSQRDFSVAAGDLWRRPHKMYLPTHVQPASFANS